MAFTRDKRATGTAGAAIALCLLGIPALAAPLSRCEAVESGMRVSSAQPFGYPGSGFVTEKYFNSYEVDPGSNGTHDRLPVTVPQLEEFSGYRIMDCATRNFLAIGGVDAKSADQLLDDAHLWAQVEKRQRFVLEDVRLAADRVYPGADSASIRVLSLRETEQSCSCRAYGGATSR